MPKNTLEKDINAALNKLQAKHGFKYKCTQDQAFGITISITTPESEDNLRREFEVLAMRNGVDPELYGKVFKNGRTTYKVVGFNLTAKKNCLRIKVIGGQGKIGGEFRCSPMFVGTSSVLERTTL